MPRMTHAERRERRRRIAEYCKTHTTSDASTEFEISPNYIRQACREFDVTPRYPLRENIQRGKSRTLLILYRLMQGIPPRKIAQDLSVSDKYVYHIKSDAKEIGFRIEE